MNKLLVNNNPREALQRMMSVEPKSKDHSCVMKNKSPTKFPLVHFARALEQQKGHLPVELLPCCHVRQHVERQGNARQKIAQKNYYVAMNNAEPLRFRVKLRDMDFSLS